MESKIVNVKYKHIDKISSDEAKELNIPKNTKGLIAIITSIENGVTITYGKPIKSITNEMQKLGDVNMLKEIHDEMPEIVKKNIRDIANADKTGETVPFNPELELYFLLQQNLRMPRLYSFEEVQKIVWFQKEQFDEARRKIRRVTAPGDKIRDWVKYEIMSKNHFNQIKDKFEHITDQAKQVVESAKTKDILNVELSFDKEGRVSVNFAEVITAEQFIQEAFCDPI